MVLIYQTNIDGIAASGAICPPKDAAEKQLDAWRWVFNPATAACFHPVAIRNPPRLTKANDSAERCSCWALSMYTSREQSIQAFKSLEKMFKNIRKTLGTHVACVRITPADGLCTVPSRNGHFDYHPYEKNAVVSTLCLVQEL
ncbi:hypothetical protein LJR232_002576 [Aquipseudomonas alcaligenes]